ncbi:ABC transporter ATP-binding protein [Paenibacillus hodogayensis]
MNHRRKPKSGFARLLEIAGEKKGLLIVACVLSSVSAVCMLVPYAAVYVVLKELLEHATDPASADKGLMIRSGVIALLGLLGGFVALYAGGMASHAAAFRILYGLRVKLSEHIGGLPLGWLNGTSTGAIKKTLEQNVEKVETFVAHQLPDLVHVAVTTVVMISVMLYLNVWMGLACLVPIIAGFAVQAALMSGEEAKRNMQRYHDSLERMSGSAVQYVRGMPAVKVFGQTVRSFRKFHADMIAYRDYCVQHTDRFQNGYLLFKVLIGSFAAFVLPVGVFLLDRNPGSTAFSAKLLFFLVMAPGVSAPMFKILFLSSALRDINEGVARFDRIFAEQPIPEPQQPKLPSRYDVAFENVSFAYGQADMAARREALSSVTFTALQGTVTALVGPSGSGKSTIANLVPRFWDVDSGQIRIGGVDVRDIPSAELMRTVAFVFQDTFLFYDTLYNNISVGCPDAVPEDVYAAAKAARCHDFILNLPQGYDTLIGEGGVYLSGGEEQRIAVARAILKNAPILVLDEATAFADPENEHEMQQALKALMSRKTVIIIAHRLSSIRDADRIVVLEEGRLREQGTHDGLLRENGLYARMWNAYADAGQWKLGTGGVRV